MFINHSAHNQKKKREEERKGKKKERKKILDEQIRNCFHYSGQKLSTRMYVRCLIPNVIPSVFLEVCTAHKSSGSKLSNPSSLCCLSSCQFELKNSQLVFLVV